MAVRLMFLGRLEDLAGTRDQQGRAGLLDDLIAAFDPALASAVRAPRIRIAINGALVSGNEPITVVDGDEVAFLPPVSGG